MSKREPMEQERNESPIKGILCRIAIMLVVLAVASFAYDRFVTDAVG